jgi:hypothetical protein
VSRATIDIPFFPLLYNTEEQQYNLRRLATKLSDFALEISLSLDCLNDLQLMVQYENFIVHSYVDGDQSELDSAKSHPTLASSTDSVEAITLGVNSET